MVFKKIRNSLRRSGKKKATEPTTPTKDVVEEVSRMSVDTVGCPSNEIGRPTRR